MTLKFDLDESIGGQYIVRLETTETETTVEATEAELRRFLIDLVHELDVDPVEQERG